MPPRRSHKKSRAGCRRCKNRKIKCDEVHPRCGNCSKHGVLCDFGNPDVLEELVTSSESAGAPTPKPTPPSSAHGHSRRRSSVRASPSLMTGHRPIPTTPTYTQPSPPSSTFLPDQVDRMMELRLLHQYLTYTSKTLLISSPMTEEIWQEAVPQMAFSGKSYLADAMLSVGALHLRSLHPEDKAIIRASHAYSASTLASYCAALNNGITSDNAEALFLTAALIAFQAAASRIFNKNDANADSDDPSSRYALPLPWFHAFQGVKAVVATSWLWIRNCMTVQAVIDSQPGFQLDFTARATSTFFGHLLEGLDEELATEEPRLTDTTGQAYAHAVSVLNWAHKNHYPAATLAFPATVSRRFVELLEAKRPRALAILTCFFALLKRMDQVWWLNDVARREVMGLVSMFEPGSKWWRHIEWPVRIALWDGNTIPTDVWGVDCETVPDQQDSVQTMMSHIELLAHLPNKSQPTPTTSVQEEFYMDPASPD